MLILFTLSQIPILITKKWNSVINFSFSENIRKDIFYNSVCVIINLSCPRQNFNTNFDRLELVFFCLEIYYKINCCAIFVFCCSFKKPERTHHTCNMLWFFWRWWFRCCFLGNDYWFPSAIGEACAPWVLNGDMLIGMS